MLNNAKLVHVWNRSDHYIAAEGWKQHDCVFLEHYIKVASMLEFCKGLFTRRKIVYSNV